MSDSEKQNNYIINWKTPIIPALLISLGISFVGSYIGHSIQYFKNFDRYVEVKGLAEKVVMADQASWQISFASSGNDLKTIYSSINQEQQIIKSFLIKEGFTSNIIQNQPISITDNTANAYLNNKAMVHYSATANISITTSDINKITAAVSNTNQLVESGVLLTNNYVTYSYNELNSVKAEMLNDALGNAKISARQFANQSDSELGKIRNASQGLFTITGLDGASNENSLKKKIRVVTTVQFFLK